jgi:hypothetical protein
MYGIEPEEAGSLIGHGGDDDVDDDYDDLVSADAKTFSLRR